MVRLAALMRHRWVENPVAPTAKSKGQSAGLGCQKPRKLPVMCTGFHPKNNDTLCRHQSNLRLR